VQIEPVLVCSGDFVFAHPAVVGHVAMSRMMAGVVYLTLGDAFSKSLMSFTVNDVGRAVINAIGLMPAAFLHDIHLATIRPIQAYKTVQWHYPQNLFQNALATSMQLYCAWGIIMGPPSVKWQNFVTCHYAIFQFPA